MYRTTHLSVSLCRVSAFFLEQNVIAAPKPSGASVAQVTFSLHEGGRAEADILVGVSS